MKRRPKTLLLCCVLSLLFAAGAVLAEYVDIRGKRQSTDSKEASGKFIGMGGRRQETGGNSPSGEGIELASTDCSGWLVFLKSREGDASVVYRVSRDGAGDFAVELALNNSGRPDWQTEIASALKNNQRADWVCPRTVIAGMPSIQVPHILQRLQGTKIEKSNASEIVFQARRFVEVVEIEKRDNPYSGYYVQANPSGSSSYTGTATPTTPTTTWSVTYQVEYADTQRAVLNNGVVERIVPISSEQVSKTKLREKKGT